MHEGDVTTTPQNSGRAHLLSTRPKLQGRNCQGLRPFFRFTESREGSMSAMTKAAKLLCMTVALAVFSFESSAADSTAEVAAMHAVDQAWARAYNGGDVDGVANLYDENAVLMPPGSPAARGRTGIRAFFAKDIPASRKDGIAFSLSPNSDGGVSGDMGWVSGSYVVKDKAGKVVDAGKYLSVSQKKGGKWVYIRDTWNSDGPQAPAESAVPMKK
jgi:ketosteroid isomerase-like protein